MLAGEALMSSDTAITVREASAEGRTTSEGPQATGVDNLGGFFVIEVPDVATAIELAGLPPADYDIEVRQVVEPGG